MELPTSNFLDETQKSYLPRNHFLIVNSKKLHHNSTTKKGWTEKQRCSQEREASISMVEAKCNYYLRIQCAFRIKRTFRWKKLRWVYHFGNSFEKKKGLKKETRYTSKNFGAKLQLYEQFFSLGYLRLENPSQFQRINRKLDVLSTLPRLSQLSRKVVQKYYHEIALQKNCNFNTRFPKFFPFIWPNGGIIGTKSKNPSIENYNFFFSKLLDFFLKQVCKKKIYLSVLIQPLWGR